MRYKAAVAKGGPIWPLYKKGCVDWKYSIVDIDNNDCYGQILNTRPTPAPPRLHCLRRAARRRGTAPRHARPVTLEGQQALATIHGRQLATL